MKNPTQRRLMALLMASYCAWAQGVEAGAARRDVTPREPVPMWGYGDRHDKLSEGTLDPLFADAVVLNVAGTKMAIVGLDLGRSPGERSLERIRARIKQETGIEHSFVGGSHTHHGPVLELTEREGRGKGKFDAALRYYADLEEAIAGVVVEADAKRKPAKLAAGSLSLDGYNINRHSKLDARPSDRDLAVLRIDNLDGKPIALVVNWSAHPTTIPSTTLQFSADYVGALKKRVMQETGAVAVFLQGAAGDQRTNRGGKDYLAYGDALGWEAVRLAGRLQPAAAEKPSLRVREERFQFKPRVDLKNPVVSMLFAQAFFLELTRNFEDEYENGVRPRLTMALLNGEIAMVGASGEFFSSHAIRLKERARVKTLFFFGYCNGYHQYFPTIEAAAEGGYGASPSEGVAEVGAGERMMDAALIWLYQMRGRLR